MQNRRFFIKNISLASFAVFSPTIFANKIKQYSKNVLIGKEKVKLYGKGYKMQKDAYLALEKMKKEALVSGVRIHVISAYRSFEHQNRIWSRKFKKFRSKGLSVKEAVNKVKEYSAIPGTSRHHWGTDVDLVDYNKKFLNNKIKHSKYIKWMDENAHKYGFYRVYTNNKFRAGYNYESWHYSYRNISKAMLEDYLKLDIVAVLKNEKIAGNQVFTKKFLNEYFENNVLGINDYLF